MASQKLPRTRQSCISYLPACSRNYIVRPDSIPGRDAVNALCAVPSGVHGGPRICQSMSELLLDGGSVEGRLNSKQGYYGISVKGENR